MTIDWREASWKRESGIRPNSRIIIAGDWCPRQSLEAVSIHNPEALYDDLLPTLRGADLRIVNLEGPLSRRGVPIGKDGPNFRIPPECVTALTVVPFDLVCLANNHVLDYGIEALHDTLETLDNHGIAHVGAGLTREEALAPTVIDVKGQRLGIVNFCEGEDGTAATSGAGTFGWEVDRVVRAVTEVRSESDVVMVIAHAGREYLPVPPPYIQRIFRSIADSGADIVIGHHPHVPQGVEIYSGVPIIYSLGNFVFAQPRRTLRRRGLLLSLELADTGVSGFRLIPCAIDATGVHRLAVQEQDWLFGQLRGVSDVLRDPERVREAWYAFVDSLGKGFWRSRVRPSIRRFVSARWRMSPGRPDFTREVARRRNQYVTPAHQHLIADGLARLASGDLGRTEPWASELLERWLHLEEQDLPTAHPT